MRSIAYEKLGRYHAAKRETALHDPDESACLAALDEVNWDGWDQALVDIAAQSDKAVVASEALGKIQDDAALADVAARSKNREVAAKALGRIRDDTLLADAIARMPDEQTAAGMASKVESEGALRRLCGERVVGRGAPRNTPPRVRFAAGRRLKDPRACAAALGGILEDGSDGVKASLDSIAGDSFRVEVVRQWLAGSKDAASIVKRLGGKPVVEPPIDESLEGYLCPNGSVHDYASTTVGVGADSDERYGVVWCEACGYRYEVDIALYKSGKHLFGCEDKKVVREACMNDELQCEIDAYLEAEGLLAGQADGAST